MVAFDLYVDFLTEMHRDELRLTAKNQGITGFTRMDRPELIVKLLQLKVQRAEDVVVKQACLWHQNLRETKQLSQAVAELESLYDALAVWNQKWEEREASKNARLADDLAR